MTMVRSGPCLIGLVAATSAVSAACLVLGAPSAEVRRRRAESAPAEPPLTVRGSLVLVRRNHVLALLALAVIVTEIFGFSFLVRPRSWWSRSTASG